MDIDIRKGSKGAHLAPLLRSIWTLFWLFLLKKLPKNRGKISASGNLFPIFRKSPKSPLFCPIFLLNQDRKYHTILFYFIDFYVHNTIISYSYSVSCWQKITASHAPISVESAAKVDFFEAYAVGGFDGRGLDCIKNSCYSANISRIPELAEDILLIPYGLLSWAIEIPNNLCYKY